MIFDEIVVLMSKLQVTRLYWQILMKLKWQIDHDEKVLYYVTTVA